MKKLKLIVSCLGLAALPACDTPDAASPVLQIQKYSDGAWVTCADSDNCALVGGRDRIRVRAAYEGLSFPASDKPEPPALAIRLDGVEVSSPPAMSSVHDASSLMFESGPYRIPGGTATNLSLRVEGAPGYAAELSGYRIGSGAAQVTVTGDCGTDPCKSFTAGVGDAHLEVLSWLDASSKLTVRSRVDGVPIGTQETTFEGPTSAERIAVLDVPVPHVLVRAGTSPNWQLELTAEGVAISPQIFKLAAPEASAKVTGCGADDCSEFQAGIGQATVELKATQLAGSKVRLRSILRGAVLDELEATFEGAQAFSPIARFSMPVPALFLAEGNKAIWRLELAGETGSFPTKEITLNRPTFAAAFLQCEADCKVAASSKLTLEASAPATFATTTVFVRTTVDGVPSDTRREIDLTDVERDRRSGTITLDAPAEAGKKLVAKVDFGSGYVEVAQVTTE